MEITRTIRIRLTPDQHTKGVLLSTIDTYTQSYNAVCKVGWEQKVYNGVELHKATYYDHKSRFGMPSQLTCSARVKATESLKSVRARLRKKKKVSCPQSKRCSIRYDKKSYSIWFDRQEVSLSTIQGRVKLPFKISEYYQSYATWKPASAELYCNRQNEFYLNVVMKTTIDSIEPTDNIIGVDLGIAQPAVDSDGNMYGSTYWTEVERRYLELIARLQSKGTKSAKRHLKRLSGKLRRFRKDCDHVLSKRIVQGLGAGAVIAMEDLTDIRSRAKARKAQRRRLHSWSFSQLQSFVEYKAAYRQVFVEYVDPRYTSQKCSQCGHIEKGNRTSQAQFKCKKCGFECHADINAAVNIAENYRKQTERAAVNQPIAPE